MFNSKPKNGFLLGKFFPPTTGHQFLCEFAQNYCENLTILVCSLPNEPIDGRLRYKWMKELFPKSNVLWCNWGDLPQEPKDENDLEFWDIWKNVIKAFTDNQKIDVIFASENYGHRLAKEVGAEFVPCDIKRICQKISGTIARENIFNSWDFLPQNVRAHYVKRITLFGPESSGKSTLAEDLAKYYKTNIIPEYGRTYTEAFGPDVNESDMVKIVKGHLASVNTAKKFSNKIVIEDTDPVMSSVWSELLTGKRNKWFDEFRDYPDLYILCKNDIPWEDDGTRYFKEEKDRVNFFNICKQELDNRKVPYMIVSGSKKDRLEQAKTKINNRFFNN